LVGMFGHILIAFILSPFLVHTLGDTKYGIWTVAVAFTGYMNLMDIGLGSAVNKYVARYAGLKDQDKIDQIISTALVLFLVMGLVIILISPVMANLVVGILSLDETLKDVVYLLIIIVSFDVAIFVVRGLFKGVFGGYQSYTTINVILLLSAIYKAAMFYVFLSYGYDLISMAAISITANVLSLLAFYLLLRKFHPEVTISLKFSNKSSAGKILNFSKFTFLTMLANQVIYYSDAFVIGYFMSTAAITYYSIPWTLAEYAKKISRSISQTYAPAVSETDARDDIEKIHLLYLSGSRYMMITSNLLSVGMIVLGGAFIAIWMGPKYRELCEAVLAILFINLYFQGPQQISYSFLQGLGRQKAYSYVTVVVSVCNLALSIILVQKWGIVGVALAAAIPQVLFHGLYVPWLTLKTIGMPFRVYVYETHLKSFIPTMALGGSLYYVYNFHYPTSYLELLASAFCCTLFYLFLVMVLMLNKSEKQVLISLVRK